MVIVTVLNNFNVKTVILRKWLDKPLNGVGVGAH